MTDEPYRPLDDENTILEKSVPEVLSILYGIDPVRKAMGHPENGTCCSCDYNGEEESECPKREDKIHCEHWWDGPDK